jgi:uncharacterized protein
MPPRPLRFIQQPWFPEGLILELEALLCRSVEGVTEKALNPNLRDCVLREAIPL